MPRKGKHVAIPLPTAEYVRVRKAAEALTGLLGKHGGGRVPPTWLVRFAVERFTGWVLDGESEDELLAAAREIKQARGEVIHASPGDGSSAS